MSDGLPSEYLLNSYNYFLEPVLLKDGKMFMWYSICSHHQGHYPGCDMCQAGSWQEIERVISDEEREYFEQLRKEQEKE